MKYPKESLAVQHENQIPNLTTLLNYLNVVFTTLFTIEMVFKMVAFKPKVRFEPCPRTSQPIQTLPKSETGRSP